MVGFTNLIINEQGFSTLNNLLVLRSSLSLFQLIHQYPDKGRTDIVQTCQKD